MLQSQFDHDCTVITVPIAIKHDLFLSLRFNDRLNFLDMTCTNMASYILLAVINPAIRKQLNNVEQHAGDNILLIKTLVILKHWSKSVYRFRLMKVATKPFVFKEDNSDLYIYQTPIFPSIPFAIPRLKSQVYLPIAGRENSRMHSFPKGIRAMRNTNYLVQVLNSSC